VTDNWMTFIGLLFMVIVLAFPRGILGLLRRRGKATA
jgi:branched-chain amino acid transport system permease protein